MGEFLTRFFGHSGRIGRKTMWMGFLALLVVAIAIELVFSLIFGFSMGNFAGMGSDGTTFPSASEIELMMLQNDWRQLIMLLILAYPLSALWFKRSHDLNKSGLLVVIYLCVAAISFIVGIIGLGYNAPQAGSMFMMNRTWLSTFIQVIYVLLALYLLVTLGFFAGTKGSNLYGSDPKDE